MRIAPMLVITLIAGSAWFFSQIGYFAVKAAEFHRQHPNEKFEAEKLDSGDFVFLSTVPASVGFVLLIVGDLAARQALPRRLGYSLSKLTRGVLGGVLGMIIVIPMMWVSSAVLEQFYSRVGIHHPHEHELLGAMKDASAQAKLMLVIGACVVAPVFEELLFRAHIQTLLVRVFTLRPRPAYVGYPGIDFAAPLPMPPIASAPSLEYATPPAPPSPRRMSWIAVLITSIRFAALHPPWMAPVILVLAPGVGYAYERTGNLWVSIIIHAAFNTSSTIIFLNMQ
jgi:membrane protease YdiL (CAAX protease family)